MTGAALSRQNCSPASAPTAMAQDLAERAAAEDNEQDGKERDARPLAIGRQAPRHAPDGLRHDRDSNHLEAVDDALPDRT